MADKKISQLTGATTPLTGTEVLPIVQSGSTVKVAVSDLTAGRAVSASSVTVSGLTASKPVFTDGSKVLTSTGTLGTDQGGTGQTTYTDGQLLIGNSTGNTLTKATLTAGGGIAVTNGTGSISIKTSSPTFNAYVGSAQSINAASFTVCAIDTEMFDTNSCFDTSTYRFTPNVAGYYQVNAQVTFQSAATLVIVSVYKNGGRGFAENIVWTTGGLTTLQCAGIIEMNGTSDYLDVRAYSDSTANTVVDGKNNTAFSATLVRAA